MASYIRFDEVPDIGKKTRCWIVRALQGLALLGQVSWYSPWRCYVFHPMQGTLFERKCLRDIATFCEERTAEQRATWGKKP